MLNKYAPYVLAAALFIFGLSLGFFVGRNVPGNNLLPGRIEDDLNNNLYSSQTANIRGEILSRTGNKLTVKNLTTNAQGEIKTSPRVIIAGLGIRPNSASASSDLERIELDKEALIQLEMVNGEYEATVIQYVVDSPLPSINPIRSPQPKPSASN